MIREPRFDGFERCLDGEQRVADLVGQSPDEVAEGSHDLQAGPLLFEAPALGDVAAAPDPADGLAAGPLRLRIDLEDTAVAQDRDVLAPNVRLGVDLTEPRAHPVRLLQILHREGEDLLALRRIGEVIRDLPHLHELEVELHDPALEVDRHDAVGRRVEGRLEERGGIPEGVLGLPQLGIGLHELLGAQVHGPLEKDTVGVRLVVGLVHRVEEPAEFGGHGVLAAEVAADLAQQEAVAAGHGIRAPGAPAGW